MPKVEIFGFSYSVNQKDFPTEPFGKFDLTFAFNIDFYLQYALPIFYIYTNSDNILFNPNMDILFGTPSYIEIELYFIKFRFGFDFTLAGYTPLDLQLMWNMEDKSGWCFGLQWITDVVTFSIELDTYVNECDFGLIGLIAGNIQETNGDPVTQLGYQCQWRKYDVGLPVFEYEIAPQLSVTGDWIPWRCNYT
eukprot:CAMPEP_0202957430 /NCGR_PEP_ID=MMETSP1396-20130829/1822_1 /ASSEMBLY_ACC=CAM_ASM_000872 /TAXON_ID= /ORGANISM="Pseudokeronopsis sp., Strain Brazil" /LENGTH=192 /DNA_ID=CAMNT_0049674895 /DNA_START=138 /DNA_END=716 /DNA_ORIENTATION=-